MKNHAASGVGKYGIAVVTAWPWPPRSGVTSKTSNLLATLALPLHVFSPEAGAHPPHIHAHEPVASSPQGRIARYLNAIRRRSLVVQSGLETEAVVPAIKAVLVADGQPAFIHLDTIATGHLVQPIRTLCHELGLQSPIVLSVNDSYSHLLRDVSRLRFPPARLAQFLYVLLVERHLLPVADVVDVVSRVDQRWLQRIAPRARVRVLPLGVAPVDEPSRPVRPTRDVLLFGSRAGLERFMEDLFLVWKEQPFTVAMIGPQPGERVIEALRRMGGQHLGYTKDLASEFRASRMVVAPSQQRSGMSTKALHAMAAGVPVAGGRCLLGLPGFIPGVHALYGADSRQLARIVVGGLADETRLEQVGSAGIGLAKTMPTWEDVCASYLDTLPSH